MSGSNPDLSVVVPTRNEADNVAALGRRLDAALQGISFEVCFVDDSDDRTVDAIAALRLENGAVRWLAREGDERAGGLSTAVIAGLHMARGTWVCVMDADLQHTPETIPALLAAAQSGAELAVASRYVRGGSRQGLDGFSRRVVSRGATTTARILFDDARASTDPLSGFFLCRRALLDGIEFRPVGFKVLLELLVCVPGLRVADVPIVQERRAGGESKAGAAQGLLFLRHLASLFFHVPGSARRWKFALVGVSGLGIFLPLLWLLAWLGLNPVIAFLPAFSVSMTWNAALNWTWTFADQRRDRSASVRRYLDWAAVAGLIMFGLYAILLDDLGVPMLWAAIAGAAAAMAVNALVNRRSVRVQPSVWAAVALDRGVQAALGRLTADIAADRSYVLPPREDAGAGIPGGVVAHAIASRRPVLMTEGLSHRAQRRDNIELVSRLVVPVVSGGDVAAVVVCERLSSRPFDAAALDMTVRAVSDLAWTIDAALAEPALPAPARVRQAALRAASRT